MVTECRWLLVACSTLQKGPAVSKDRQNQSIGIDVLILHVDALLISEDRFDYRLGNGEPSSFDRSSGTTLTGIRRATGEMDRWQELVVEEVGGWESKFGMVGLRDWRERLLEVVGLFDHIVLFGQEGDQRAIQRIARHLDRTGKDFSVWIGDFAWHDGDRGTGIAEGVQRVTEKLARRQPIADVRVWLRLDSDIIGSVQDRLAWRSERPIHVRGLDAGMGLLRGHLTPDLYLRRYQRAAAMGIGAAHE